jgi:hypothetical protein
MPNNYEKLRPYWEAWKSADPADSALRDGMIEICKALAGDNSAKPPSDAFSAALELRTESLEYLKGLDDFDASTQKLKVYRGITDDAANRLRRATKGVQLYEEEAGVPISYSTSRGAALGFARKGKYLGALYQQFISLESAGFIDRGYYKDGNLHAEAEILVCRSEPVTIANSDVVEAKVDPQKHGFHSKADKQKWEQERERLKNEDSQDF